MSTRVAINGFGRIGRLVFRHFMEHGPESLEVVAVNDIAPLDNLAYLLRHDSVHRHPSASIEARDSTLTWNDRRIEYLSIKNPSELPWKAMDVALVIESSGQFTEREQATQHLAAGADRVVITAPAKGDDLTVCPGVNDEAYRPEEHRIISNASCTTNALAPVAMVLDREFGIEYGALTTVHAYTNSQKLVDSPNKKWRRGRAAAFSIVPTTTGAARATTRVLPQLEGRMDGMAMRVPVADGSIIDFVVQTREPVTVDRVNEALRSASRTDRLQGILGYTEEELVSADIIGSTYSGLVDASSTMTFGDHMVKVIAWYDNEWGYARRVVDLAGYIAQRTYEGAPVR